MTACVLGRQTQFGYLALAHPDDVWAETDLISPNFHLKYFLGAVTH
jgi:hypothetical protein